MEKFPQRCCQFGKGVSQYSLVWNLISLHHTIAQVALYYLCREESLRNPTISLLKYLFLSVYKSIKMLTTEEEIGLVYYEALKKKYAGKYDHHILLAMCLLNRNTTLTT